MIRYGFVRNTLRLLTLAGVLVGASFYAMAEDTPPPRAEPRTTSPSLPFKVQPTPGEAVEAPAVSEQPQPVETAPAPAAPVEPQPIETTPAPAAPEQPQPVETTPAPAAPEMPQPIETDPAPAAPEAEQPQPVETTPAPAGVSPAIPATDADSPLPAAPETGPETPVVLNHHEAEDPRLLTGDEVDQPSLLGSYLAGRVARGLRDQDAAAEYFGKALALDPDSEVLRDQAFILELSRGNWENASDLANELITRGEGNRFARMVRGIDAFMKNDLKSAETEFSKSEQRSPLGKMISLIIEAWLFEARGDGNKALNHLRKLDSLNWAKFYQDYHTAMIADQARRFDVADKVYQRLFEKDPHSLRMMDAYVRHLVVSGQSAKALTLIDTYKARNGEHPLVLDLQERVSAGEKLDLIAPTPQDGLAELFYGIGDALTGDGGVDLGMIYLQAGLRLREDLPLARLALAEAYEGTQHYEEANLIYDRIDKRSPLWPNAAVRRAFNLNSLEKLDDAKATLDELLGAYPKDLNALEAQGNILRAHKRYGEAVDYYSRAIELLSPVQKNDWKYFYSRGVCYERLKDWPKAEADLEKARSLDSDQPLVLNYLGYSWVDQNTHLATAMRLIRRAVELKPDDGYFVDSLGWAHYRLGNYPKAVEELERAVELKPDDPVINDHLGDVYWRVGRKLEAQFQWAQSLTLEPEPEDIPKINEKLEKGLPEPEKQATAENGAGKAKDIAGATAEAGDAAGTEAGAGAKASDNDAGATLPAKTIGTSRTHVVRGGDSLWSISKRYYGNGGHTELIKRANGMRDGGRIKLHPGMKLIIPPLQ